ncbi:MAG: serine hydroxymethyltransferase [Gammaproteobacteria bacterium]|nr:serine hydroxymethyltransferase [Gammaproteobacteria bacterium]
MPSATQPNSPIPAQTLGDFDPELKRALDNELRRQEEHIELIASENYVSARVLEAQGSVLTNKYAEGYPGKRYYGGCEFVDIAEQLAIDRAKRLFGAAYANVQPHSGSQANAAVYFALMKPGDTLLGMSLDHGGHLTHGAKVNLSGKVFNAVQYGIDPQTGLLDYEQVQRLAREHKPRLIVAGFSAYSRVIDWQRFRTIADEVGAYLMVDMAHVAGLCAVGVYPNPVAIADVTTTTTHKTLRGPRGGLILARPNDEIARKLSSLVFPGMQGGPLMHVIAAKAVAFQEALQPQFADYQRQVVANARAMCKVLMSRGVNIVSGGTDNHLFLVDLVSRNITGKDADAALQRANITVNKNAVPNDPRPPMVTSGLRIGTPAITTRGFREREAEQLSHWIADILDAIGDDSVIARVKREALELCRRHPVYGAR